MEFCAKDNRYFVTEIMPHYEYIRRFIFTITENEYLSSDIVQETMLLAWKNVMKVREYENLRGGLKAVAQNALYSYYRKHGKEMECVTLNDVFLEVGLEQDVADIVTQKESKEEFLAYVNGLKGNQLRVILLYYYFEMSLKEIGETLHLKYNTVLSLHRRGIQSMRKIMGVKVKEKKEKKEKSGGNEK